MGDEVLGKGAGLRPALSPLRGLRQPPAKSQDEQIGIIRR
jgi:hypothetical protein